MPLQPHDTVTGNPYSSPAGEIPRGLAKEEVENICRVMITEYEGRRVDIDARASEKEAKRRWRTYGVSAASGMIGGVIGTLVWNRFRGSRTMLPK